MHIKKKLNHLFLQYLPKTIRRKIVRSNLPEFNPNLEGVIFRPAIKLDDYIKCFRLLHDVYVQAGYSEPSETALRITPYHSLPDSKVFLGCLENCDAMRTPLYTISLFPDSSEGLPMDSAFKSELDILRSKGRKIAEVGCLASNPSFRRGDQNIPMLGNRVVHHYAEHYLDIDDLVITVHPKYLPVYEDILLFEKIGKIDDYNYVNGNPAVAMRIDLNTAEKEYKKAYAHAPIEKDLHHFFFSADSKSIDLSSEIRKDKSEMIMGALTGYYSLFASSESCG